MRCTLPSPVATISSGWIDWSSFWSTQMEAGPLTARNGLKMSPSRRKTVRALLSRPYCLPFVAVKGRKPPLCVENAHATLERLARQHVQWGVAVSFCQSMFHITPSQYTSSGRSGSIQMKLE